MTGEKDARFFQVKAPRAPRQLFSGKALSFSICTEMLAGDDADRRVEKRWSQPLASRRETSFTTRHHHRCRRNKHPELLSRAAFMNRPLCYVWSARRGSGGKYATITLSHDR